MTPSPFRKRIADWLDRSRWLCSAMLTVWMLGYRVWPWEFHAFKCRRGLRDPGGCWCGKFCPKGTEKREVPA